MFNIDTINYLFSCIFNKSSCQTRLLNVYKEAGTTRIQSSRLLIWYAWQEHNRFPSDTTLPCQISGSIIKPATSRCRDKRVRGSELCTSHDGQIATTKRSNCECIASLGRTTPRQSFYAIITTPCQVWSCWTYPLLYYSVFASDTLLDVVTLTFDLEHLQCIACDVMKLCTRFKRNRAIRGGVRKVHGCQDPSGPIRGPAVF